MLTIGSLFTGIGGFDLGFERAGMRVVWQCEKNDYCRRVLARHWPGVPCYPDVRALVADAERWGYAGNGASRRHEGHGAADGATERRQTADGLGEDDADGDGAGLVPVPVPYVDVLCGGFPCQDLSYAGKGAGIDGERSGLWREFARLIGELRPRYVVIENVPALASRGLDRVLADLAACGLDAEWDHLPASAFGAPHRRDRVWVVAYADERRLEVGAQLDSEPLEGTADGHPRRGHADRLRDEVADATVTGLEGTGLRGRSANRSAELADAEGAAIGTGLREDEPRGIGRGRPGDGGGPWNAWATEPDVGRVANGIPARVDRLAALGNALVPQIAEFIGRRITEWETASGRLATLPD